ncbi:MAG: FtsW/RodA/SpoVE family cell cycle protein [Anaerovoracaceae bacterium]|jgi:cell division protein FtsW
MDIISGFFSAIGDVLGGVAQSAQSGELYTSVARWIFIALALIIVLKSIISLLRSRSPSEIWAYFHIGDYKNLPITHWENTIGRARSSDIEVDDRAVSRSHGILTRDNDGIWSYMDLGSSNGAYVDGQRLKPYRKVPIRPGTEITLGRTVCTLFPVSVQERMNNVRERKRDTELIRPWLSMIAITIFQLMTIIQLMISLGDKYDSGITVSYIGLIIIMWTYILVLSGMRRKGFEIELIAFFLSGISLAVMATCYPTQVFKQFLGIALGVALFVFMCAYLRDLDRTIQAKKIVCILAAALLLINLVFGENINGQHNWIHIAGMSVQPSEIVKIAFIWVGAATMEELYEPGNTLRFTLFSFFCFICLALMGDFGTAIIFFATFAVISFLRSGDFSKLLLLVGVAAVAGLLVIRFRSYIGDRIDVWGHVWEHSDKLGYQQTRTMSAAASGGLVGEGAGNGWLKHVMASETDLVFGLVAEEWGLIIAVLAVLSIVTLSIFAYRSILAGRSTYYTIAACAATTIFLLQTILNVFGSVDLLPLTGVTFPFVSAGGTSILASWGMLAFVKAADTRQNASLAVSLKDKGLGEEAGL